jgi:hypothetical protein
VSVRHFSTERFFTGFSTENMERPEPVFQTEDLSDEECAALAASVQKELDEIYEGSDGKYYFELGPAADENLQEFILLKSKWLAHAGVIGNEFGERGGCWQYSLHIIHEVAQQHVEIIRGLKRLDCPSVFFQCHLPNGEYSSFARVDSLTERELKVLTDVLETELNRIGTSLRVIGDWHAINEPHEYVQAKLDFESFLEFQSDETNAVNDYEYEMAAENAFDRCIKEVKRLRFVSSAAATEGAPVVSESGSNHLEQSLEPSEEFRTNYRDPDNYWRNVWLYEQRRAGKTNAAILTELTDRATEFAPLV